MPERRGDQLNIRVNLEEKEKIEARARAAGKSVSDFIRCFLIAPEKPEGQEWVGPSSSTNAVRVVDPPESQPVDTPEMPPEPSYADFIAEMSATHREQGESVNDALRLANSEWAELHG